ncbi:30397_t:CDS:2, partial [Racocetra persica]
MIFQNIIEFIVKLFILIFATYIFYFYYKYFTRPNPLPGPFPLPFIGNLLNIGYDINKFYEQCQRKYGDISEILLDRRYIIVTRPDYIVKLFAPSEYFMRLPYSQGMDEIGHYKNGIVFNGDSKSWHYNRQYFNETLSLKFIDASITHIYQLYEEMSGYWQSLGLQHSLNENNNNNWSLETDFSAWFHPFTNDVTSMLVTGKRTYSIATYYNTQSIIKSEYPDALVEDGYRFTEALVKHLESLLFFANYGPFIRHYIPIIKSQSNSYLNNRNYLFDKLENIIKKRRKEIEEMQDTEMKTDMLTSLITAKTVVEYEEFRPMTDKEIRGNLLDAFIGGSGTTANLFCFMTYYLCKHPHVKQKMLSEIDYISDKFYASNDLKKLKYCEAIIKETHRLMPGVTIIHRHITKEREFAGYKWPAGTSFHVNVKGAHSHSEFWDNPEVFYPDRFLNNDYDKSAFMPFGGGKRICPGKSLATIQ